MTLVTVPPCYTKKEWEKFEEDAQVEFALKSKLPDLRQLACTECDLPYQREMASLGRCHPPKWALTPIAQAFKDTEDDSNKFLPRLK